MRLKTIDLARAGEGIRESWRIVEEPGPEGPLIVAIFRWLKPRLPVTVQFEVDTLLAEELKG